MTFGPVLNYFQCTIFLKVEFRKQRGKQGLRNKEKHSCFSEADCSRTEKSIGADVESHTVTEGGHTEEVPGLSYWNSGLAIRKHGNECSLWHEFPLPTTTVLIPAVLGGTDRALTTCCTVRTPHFGPAAASCFT